MKLFLFPSNYSNPTATENVNNVKNLGSIHRFTLCKKIRRFVNNKRNMQYKEEPGTVHEK